MQHPRLSSLKNLLSENHPNLVNMKSCFTKNVLTRSFFFSLLFSALSVQQVFATDWYVNDNSLVGDVYTTAVGNDGNDGLTPNTPFATLTQALLVSTAGDVIRIDAGTYVTVGAGVYYDINKAITILGPKAGVDPRPSANSLRVPGSTDEAIFDGNNITGSVFYINTVNAFNVTIDGLDIRNSTARCIHSDVTAKSNVTVKNCIFGGSVDDAVNLIGITNCTFEHNYVRYTSGNGDGVAFVAVTNGLIRYNEISNTNSSNAAIYVYGGTPATTNVTVSCNYVHDCYGSGPMVRIGQTGGGNTFFIQDNILTKGGGRGIQVELGTVTISGNQISNLNGDGIGLQGAATNVTISSNAIYHNIGKGVTIIGTVNASTINTNNNWIFDNTGIGFQNLNANVTNATNNWWGASNGPSGVGPGSGDDVSSNVNFTPFLTSAPTTAGLPAMLAFTESSGTPDDGIISPGSLVDFSATAGYTNYNFKVNGISVQNGASPSYSTTTLANGSIVTVTVDGNCIDVLAISNKVVIYDDVTGPVPTTRYVDLNGGTCGGNTPCYLSLYEAIDESLNGDGIIISEGVLNITAPSFYFDINKSLTIEGANAGVDPRPCVGSTRVSGSASETIIDGNSITGSLFHIRASNVTIDGIEFRNSVARLINSNTVAKSNVLIKNCILGGSVDDAVEIQGVSNSSVEYNFVQNTLGGGDGINISEGSSNSSIQYNEITGVNNNNGVIYVYGPASNITIKCNKIYNCNGAGSNSPKIRIGATGGGSGFLIQDNIIIDNAGTGPGIRVELGSTTVEGNQIANMTSTGPGIFFTGAGAGGAILRNAIYNNVGNGITLAPSVVVTNTTINNNLIYNNSGIGLLNQHASLTVNATNNWWGATNGPSGVGMGSGDDISVRVNAVPFLTSVPTSAGLPPVLALTESSGSTADDGIICSGGSVTFTGTTGYTNYDFLINDISAQSSASNTFITSSLADNDVVKVQVTGHCSGCLASSDGITISVEALPVVTLTLTDNDATLCESAVTLSGESPAGGTFSGAGVTGNMINPQTAGPGTHVIDYTYTNVNMCVNTASDNFVVTTAGVPNVHNTNSNKYFCSIQASIDDAQTMNGDVLAVSSGTYSENVNATAKSLTFAPGASPGCVTITGDMTLNGGDVLNIEIDGTTPCTQYDRFVVNGTVTLGGASLTVVLGYVPASGDQITIIDGSNPIVGQFAQGNSITIGANSFLINYTGGDGNDVVLTACPLVQNTNTLATYCTLQDAINDASPGHTLQLLDNITEGIISLNKALVIDGDGKTLTSTSATYGIDISVAGASILDLTVDRSVFHGGTFGIFANCGADNLALTNTTVKNGGGSGYAINGSDNVVMTNVTATDNLGNGISISNCDNLTINGITTSGNAFVGGFSAGIGLFTSSVYCLPAGINGFTLGGTISIAEPVKVYSQKANAADVITGLVGSSIEWAVGTSAVDRSYWPDKPTAYAVVDALFEAPYNLPNTTVFVAKVATDDFYVDDDPNGDATPPMLIQTAVNFLTPGKTIFVENGAYNERLALNKSLTIDGTGTLTTVLFGNSLVAGASGITINSGVTNVTIQDLSVINYVGSNPNSTAGIYAVGGNNNLTLKHLDVGNNVNCSGIYIEGNMGITGVLIDDVQSHGHMGGARGIVIWNGFKSNITIQNCEVYGNNCCGIELQDGTASGVTLLNNNVHDNADSGISPTGLTGPGANLIDNNTVKNNGRFGIELKLSNGSGATSGPGSIVVQNNTVSRNVSIIPETRDIAGIAVYRRGYVVGNNNVNIPTGVVVRNNTVNGFTQPSSSEGFGIVIEGTNHSVTNNIVSGCEVGIQQQAGHTPYVENTNTDGDQNNLADTYFGRGNAPYSCGNTVSGNTLTNTINTRNVGAGVNTLAGVVVNTNNAETFCSIQGAIDDGNTIAGHTILANAGTYNEDVNVTKSLTINGVGIGATILRGTYAGTNFSSSATLFLSTNNITVQDMTITRDYGNTLALWYASSKNQGVTFGQTWTGNKLNRVRVADQRNGIYIINSQNYTVTNSIIENNRTGFQMVSNVSGGTIQNNFIRNNFTHGIVLSYDGGLLTATNLDVSDNSITGNWYSEVNFQRNLAGPSNIGPSSGLDFSCNWYGTTAPTVNAVSPGEPGYNVQPPSQFGGTDPMLPNYLMGVYAGLIPYTPWTITGVDDDLVATGFQPVPSSCIGTQVSISIVTNTPATCTGGPNNGSLTTSTVDGNAPFTYAWSNGGITSNISGLAAGTYTVTVTDFYNSMATASATVAFMPVTIVSTGIGYPTIQAAINAAVSTDEIQVCSGTFTEQLTVNKSLTIKGIGTKPLINGTGTDRVISVTAPNVTLDSLNVQFDQVTVLNGIYAPTSGAFNNLSITSCTIAGMGTTGAPVFGSYGIRLGSFGGVVNDLVTLSENVVTHSGNAPLGRAVRSYNVHGTWENNMFNGYYSIQGGDFAGGLINISSNNLMGACEINNLDFAGTHTIVNNSFSPSNAYGAGTDFAQIELKNLSRSDAFLTIQENAFEDYTNFGIFSGRANNVTVHDNMFNPEAGAINYRSVRVDTKQRTTGAQTMFNSGMTLTKNTFNGNSAIGQAGVAIEIANSDDVSGFTGVTIGTASNENNFAANNAKFLLLNNETGSTSGDLLWTGMYVSNKAKVTLDVNVVNNKFDTGSGLQLPSATSTAGLYTLENKIQHKIDDAALGFATTVVNKAFVTTNSFVNPPNTTPSVQRGIDALSPSGTVHVEAGSNYTGGADMTGAGKDVALAPGSSPACVTITGNMVLNGGDALDMEINGTTACTDYDQFIVNGTVSLGGASLNLSLGFTPANGNQFTLIDNDLGDAVTGQFLQGSSITVGGTVLSINYAGGDGNDVVLTACGSGSVHNMTSGESFCNIQDAINDASAMDLINVDAGTYNENIVINKALTLNGIQANNDCSTRMGAESIINGAGASGTKTIDVQADGVTINGFTIKNPLGSFGVYAQGGTDNLTVRNNIITDIGNNSNGSVASYGVSLNLTQGGAGMSNINILNNCISDIRGGENTALTGAAGKANNGSGVGIGAGFTDANFDITGLNIDGNKISNIRASTILFSDGGKGAYGVLINVGAKVANLGKAVSPMILNNEITDLEGLWAHGIGLEGETPGAMVKNNIVDDLVDHKGNTDAIGVLLEENDGAMSVVVKYNSFNNMALAIKNLMTPTIDGTCNWYGTADAVAIAALISGNVTYTPYLSTDTEDSGTIGFQPMGMCDGTPVVIISATPTSSNFCGANGSIDVDFTGGTAPYTIEWAGPVSGGPVPATSIHTIGSLTTGMYTITVTDDNGSTATVSATVGSLPVKNLTGPTYYATIQAAIDAATAGDVLEVCAGNYTENINISKALTINGPNVGISGTGVRTGEAVLLNCYIDINNAGNTTLDGFHVKRTDGITGAYPLAPTNQIELDGGGTNTVQNCIFERLGSNTGQEIRAIATTTAGGPKVILNNKITGDATGGLFGGHKSWARGIYIDAGAFTVTFTGNTIENCRTAINVDDYNNNVSISGNTFNNNGTHISLGGATIPSGSFVMGANNYINNPASTMVNLSNVAESFRFDITSSSLNGTLFSALGNASLFDVESRMAHKEVTAGKKGKVIYKAGNQYVNNFTVPVSKIDKIQNSIKYGDANDIINLEDGTYNEKLIVDKSFLTLQGVTNDKTLYIIDGMGLGVTSGIYLNNGITNTTIKDLTVQKFTGTNGNANAGIYGSAGNNNLTVTNVALLDNPTASGFYANGPIDNVSITNSMVVNNGGAARGIVIWNGLKTNITITGNMVTNNTCCGIELQDGDASAVTVSNNTIDIGGGDNAIGLVGLNPTVGANTVNSNIIIGGGRFGIEIKNPAGGVTVSGNSVSLTTVNSDLRDRAGIAVFRRGVLDNNIDVPNGVTITANTVTGYTQTLPEEGFGIVIEGTNHVVTGNNVTNCNIGIQEQGGAHANSFYPNITGPYGDGQGNGAQGVGLSPNYFGRGNAPFACGNTVGSNTFGSNGMDTRTVIMNSYGLVTNVTSGEYFCNIQAAINDAQTLDGHTLNVGTGTFNENVTLTKDLTINGAGPANTILTPTVACTGAGITISANNATVQNLKVTNFSNGLAVSSTGVLIDNVASVSNCNTGLELSSGATNLSVQNSKLNNNTATGFRKGTAAIVSGFTLNNSEVKGNVQGCFIGKNNGAGGTFDNVTITNSNFSNNTRKGMYFEALSNAMIDGVVMDNSGTDAAYDFNNGIDINLKYSSYSNITIQNCDITNSGANGTATDPQNAAVIAVKARNDGSYSGNPATLTDVTIKNNLITGPQNGIRFGEIGVVNAGPSNVTVEGNDLSFAFGNKAIVRRTNDDVTVKCNWHGTTDLPTILATFANAGTGSTILSTVLPIGTDGSGAVGFQPSGSCTCPSGNVVTNVTRAETFCTIQAAIDDSDTQNGDIITASAGTYIEDITVNKAVKLRGNNYGINPNTGMRVAESILVPATSDPDPNTGGQIMYLTAAASGAEIDGFTLDGDNPSLTSVVNINGANIDAVEAMSAYDGTGNLNVNNNIIKNLSYSGIDFYNFTNGGGVTSNNYITNNKIDNIAQSPYGVGILIYNNFYANVTDNVMTRVRVGVQTGNFYSANTGSTNSISNNQITSARRGIFHNLTYGSATAFNINNNIITTTLGATTHLGISLSSIGGTVGANVMGNNIDGAYAGVDFWNCTSSNIITVTGGNITNCNYGVFASNYDGFNSNANTGTVAIAGVNITGSTMAAVYVKDNPSNTNNADITLNIKDDCEIVGTGQTVTGILVEGSDAHAVVQDNDASIHGFAIGIDVNAGSATVTNNHIYDNGIGVRFINDGTGDVNTNKFFETGLPNGKDLLAESDAGAVTATPNNWFAGATFGVQNLSVATINATLNYWNDASGPSDAGPGTGAAVSSMVDYCPWLDDAPVIFGGSPTNTSATTTISVMEMSGTTNNDGITCAGDNVTLDATATGATAYLWAPGGETTASISVAPTSTTTYSVTVTFAGCTATDEQQITVNPYPVAVISGNLSICFGNSTTLTASGGDTYLWDDNSTNPVRVVTTAGTYSVTVTSAGCTDEESVMVTTPPAITIAGTVTDVSCFDGSNGAIDLNVSGGTPGYTYMVMGPNGVMIPYTGTGYATGALDGQNGWDGGLVGGLPVSFTNDGPGKAEVINSVAHAGTQSWKYSRGYSSPGAGTPFTPVVASVGSPSSGASGDKSIVKFAFKAVTPTDGSLMSVYEGSVGRDDRTGGHVVLEAKANGNVEIRLSKAIVASPYFQTVILGEYPGGVWHELEMTTSYPNTVPGDINTWGTTTYKLDGVIIGSEVTWSHWWREQNGFTYTPGSSLKFANPNSNSQNGFYLDDLSMEVQNTTLGTTVGYFGTGFEAGDNLDNLIAGDYTVKVTDANSCSASQTFTVNQPTDLTLTAGSNSPICYDQTLNLTATAGGGTPGYTYNWTGPNGFASTDEDPSLANATTLAAGTYYVTVTDANGCVEVASTTVVVNAAPTITCPAPIVAVTSDGGSGDCFAAVSLTHPTPVSDCTPVGLINTFTNGTPVPGSLPTGGTVTAGGTTSYNFATGQTVVTYTATDNGGNMTTCAVTVTVTDNELPIITCPANVGPLNILDPRDPYATGWATATDNCTGVIVTYDDNRAGLTGCNATGTIVRTFTATDASNNAVTCAQTITIHDVTPPVMTACPSNITEDTDPGECDAVVIYTDPTAIDVGYRQDFENAAFVSGSSVNTPSTDWNNSNSSMTRVLSLTDGIASKSGAAHAVINSIGLPANTTGAFGRMGGYSPVFGTGFRASQDIYIDLTDPKVVNNTYGWDLTVAASKQDNSHLRDFVFHAAASGGQVKISASNNTNPPNPQIQANNHTITASGWYTFEWVFKNNTNVLEVDLNLRDASGTWLWTETRSNPADLINTIVGGNRYMWFTFIKADKLAIDNSLMERNATVACVAPSGSEFNVGTTAVICTATDACNQTANCTFNVTVTDDEDPVVTCPANITQAADAGECETDVTFVATATDNCSAVVTYSHAPGSTFPVGTTTVTATATDMATNTDICMFTVTVTDTEFPVITCPPSVGPLDILEPRDPYYTGWATATDNCTGVIVTYDDDRSGLTGCNTTGMIARTFTATDASNNAVTCAITVTIHDVTPPEMTACPLDITTNVDPGECDANVIYADPTAIDVGYRQDFENAAFVSGSSVNIPSTDWNDYNSSLARVTSGTDGITSKTGAAHAVINSIGLPANTTGAFSRMGGYSPVFGTGFRASQDIYIDLTDPKVVDNTYGWDLTVAASKQDNSHLRDFVFHAAASGGQVKISGSNNSNVPNPQIQANNHTITASGWYTFEWVFKNNADVLEVDLNLRDASGTWLWTETRSNPADLISSIVGGNRYMWFTFIKADKLAIDNSLMERNATVACVAPSGSAFPVGTTPVTCTATDACGQTANCTFDIIVNPTVVPLVSIAASANPICVGTSVTFTATPTDGGNAPAYQWYVNNIPAGTNSPMFTTSGLVNNDQVKVEMTSNYPCPVTTLATSNVITMTVFPLPMGANANSVSCSGAAVGYDLQVNVNTLGNNINSNFSWVALSNNPQITGESLSAQAGDVINDVLVNLTNITQTVIYRVTPTSDPEGCVGPFFDVFVTVNPTPDANATGNVPQCSGATTNITVTNPNNVAGTTYNWSAPATAGITELGSAIGANNVPLTTHIMQMLTNTTNAPIVVTFTITPVGPAPGFCTGTSITRDVTVNPTPAGAITASQTAVCSGTSVMLTFTATAGTGMFTIVVNGNSYPNVTSGVSFLTVMPTMTTTYTLNSIADANGCSNASPGSSVMVSINPPPTATIGGTTAVCLNDAQPDITFTGAGGATPYTFTYKINGGADQMVSTTGLNTSVTVAAPTGVAGSFVYSLISVSGGDGCTQTQTGSATITVNPLPTASVSGTTTVCQNATAPNVTFTGATGTAPYTFTYTINGGSNLMVSTMGMSNSVTVAAPTGTSGVFTYALVSVSDANGCTQGQSGSAVITVNAAPTATISGTTAVCQDAAAPLITFTGANGIQEYTFTYTINGGSNQMVTTSGSNSVTVAAPTGTPGAFTYALVSVSDGNSCSQTQSGSATVTVNTLPTATISGTISACKDGPSPDITFTGANGALNYTFTYTINGGSTQTVTTSGSNSVTVPAPTGTAGVFTYDLVSVSDGNGCSQTQSGSAVVTITVCSEISGKLIWEADRMGAMTGVNGAIVNLTGDATDSDLTGIPGTYSLDATSGSNFVVTPVKNRAMPDALNGVTAGDASRIQQHVTGAFPLTDPYKLLAADVNTSGHISSQDVSLISQAVLGNPIARLYFINKTWRFVPKAYVFPDPLAPWGAPESITLTGTAINQDFIGLKLGDVNNSANPVNTPSGLAPDLVWTVQDQYLQQDEAFTVEFKAENFDELLALQFGLHFNPASIQFLELEPVAGSPIQSGNFGLFNVATGDIRGLLAMVQTLSVPNGTPVFRMRFKALKNGLKLSDVLRLDNNLLLGEAYAGDFTPGPVSLEYLDISTAVPNTPGEALRLSLLQNRPNPFTDATAIGFVLPEECEAQIRIFDGSGRLIADQKAWYPKGYNEMKFQLKGYAGEGVLYYELTTTYGTLSKKMVLIRE